MKKNGKVKNATFANTFIWIAIAAVTAAVFGVFRVMIQMSLNFGGIWAQMLSELDPEAAEQLAALLPMVAGAGIGTVVWAFCMGILLIPVSFFMGSLLWFAIAKLFGGTGEFEEQTYLLGTFSAPLIILNAGLSIIPVLNFCTWFFILVYQLVLTYFALKVSHNLTSGRAVGVVLTLLGGIFLLICCLIALFSFAIAAVLGAADATLS